LNSTAAECLTWAWLLACHLVAADLSWTLHYSLWLAAAYLVHWVYW
jgi:hypothetical protein